MGQIPTSNTNGLIHQVAIGNGGKISSHNIFGLKRDVEIEVLLKATRENLTPLVFFTPDNTNNHCFFFPLFF